MQKLLFPRAACRLPITPNAFPTSGRRQSSSIAPAMSEKRGASFRGRSGWPSSRHRSEMSLFRESPPCCAASGFNLVGGWRDVAAKMTFAYTGKKLSQVETGSAFSCRARYDKPGTVPSEHAKGDAVDIGAFDLDDNRRIPVKEQGSDTERNLVRALRTTACGYFTTVLGPGSDAAHAEHFHFDTGIHGASTNYRICE
jgi:hypothetical protein